MALKRLQNYRKEKMERSIDQSDSENFFTNMFKDLVYPGVHILKGDPYDAGFLFIN